MNRGTKLKKVFSNLIILISLCFFVFFAYKIYSYKQEENKQKQLNNNIIQLAVKNIETDNQKENNNLEGNMLPIEIDFKSLKNTNKDIIAWIYSEGTPINYPIVQSTDNDYYLRRLINGTYNQAGTIFLDCRNSSNFEDYNSIIYGHNMKNDSMFGTISNYKDQEYFDLHREMFLITEGKSFKIELFAGYITSSESDIYIFPKTSSSNEKLINTAIQNSTFKSNVTVNKEDRIITLSTCSYNFENARYILLGVLKEM